ncbi:uncharacterized protein F5891DRAFT_1247798 [Suillus fuscotomentosus]|uniref:Uncharacterized protein n=1 Tax=Suillus fuscotomentosus TaxID=1912939 RepID=A0AAD4E100_9AGAM|nr:uncharacterized protein F5891DRAFT_1247798 [Suillus fuscotomentosus]KAG1896283.1 hypothetical protein F5891DRAFT_1247798 [Suillus fuscotomentosus]
MSAIGLQGVSLNDECTEALPFKMVTVKVAKLSWIIRIIDGARHYENAVQVGVGVGQSGVKREDVFISEEKLHRCPGRDSCAVLSTIKSSRSSTKVVFCNEDLRLYPNPHSQNVSYPTAVFGWEIEPTDMAKLDVLDRGKEGAITWNPVEVDQGVRLATSGLPP